MISETAHQNQMRKFSGEKYVSHPISVAELVSLLKDSKNIELLIVSALLHDVVEDSNMTISEIEHHFGKQVASIVNELTSDKEKILQLGKKEYLANKMLNMSSYALVIKLIDRLHNISDIINLPIDHGFRQKMILETEFILNKLNDRKLSNTHIKIINLIQRNITKLK